MDQELQRERYELVTGRIREIAKEESVPARYQEYFQKTALFLEKVDETLQKKQQGLLDAESEEEAKKRNKEFYQDILGKNYDTSYANPSYAVEKLGEEFGGVLSFLYTELRACIGYAYEGRAEDITIFGELFVEVYGIFAAAQDEVVDKREVMQTIYYFYHDYSETMVERNILEMIDPSLDFFMDIVMHADLSDTRYLYRYGEYISDCELEIARFLNSMEEEKIQSMADTYTEGYRLGFVNLGVDLSKKKTVQIHYPIGFERMVRAAVKNFEKMGLQPTISRDPVLSLFNRGHGKRNAYVTAVNKQYEYDHKDDLALFLDRKLMNRKLEVLKQAYEENKDKASRHAGPAVIETFGEIPFAPVSKPEACTLSTEQQKLSSEYTGASSDIVYQYINGEERSFTIIAFPVPEIGEKFEEIFDETVKINTLDYHTYERIQAIIIDTLNRCSYVEVKGMNGNRTDMHIQLYPITDPQKEVIFENCVADVNIPVGEVFTSPVLEGTHGTLHVSRVFLNELEYHNLEMTFEDGMIKTYTCTNFDNEEENREYLKANVLYHYDTLPIGEFAIGTNTTAYMTAKKYDIGSRFPILIAEKTGPHFAVGDTCYSRSEDVKVYNEDGKEIVAKDNSVSLLRKTDPSRAYFGCHTDITIPYDELGSIIAYDKEGNAYPVIEKGRFVLAGCEELNKPME